MINRSVNIRILLKISLAIVLSLSLLIIIESRGHPVNYFSTRCLNYRQKDFSRRLNDRIVDYSAAAKQKGIKPSRSEKELRKYISDGKLVRVKTGRKYISSRFLPLPACGPFVNLPST